MPLAGHSTVAAVRSVEGALIGGTISEMTGGKFVNGAISGAVQGAMEEPETDQLDNSVVGGGGEVESCKTALPVSVPSDIKIEADGFETPEQAAVAAGKQIGPGGEMARHPAQEPLLGIVKTNKGWGYLTPGWGPVSADNVCMTPLIDAYSSMHFNVSYWMHGHWNAQLNFSAQDFGLVYGSGTNKTFLVNQNNEVRELTTKDVNSALSQMRRGGSIERANLQGLRDYHKVDGLPGLILH